MTRLPRRAVLTGLGASIALPLLDAMREARAQAVPPARLVAFYFPHGVWGAAWRPAATGRVWPMPPSLAPLAPFRDALTVLSGLDNEPANALQPAGGPHSIALGTLLTGRPLRRDGTVDGPSWDRVAARALDAPTRFRSLCAVAEDTPIVHEGTSSSLVANYSWDGSALPVPPSRTPRALFDKLFGRALDPAAARRRASVLDHTRDSLLALRAALGAADRARVDQHLTAIRELERELDAPAAACDVPARPSDAPTTPAARARQMMRLVALALRCDLTRVASLALGNGLSEHVLTDAGLALTHHEQSHRPDADVTARVTAYQMQLLADFARALADTPDGDATLLDRVVLVATSEVSEGWSHSTRGIPFLLLGRGGGHRGGAHHDLGGAPIARALLTAMRMAGARVPRFGDDGDDPLEAFFFS